MRPFLHLLPVLTLLLALPSSVSADDPATNSGAATPPAPTKITTLVTPYIFSDDMVLQRDRPVPVWGQAPEGTQVTVSFAGQEKRATAGADSHWEVVLDPLTLSAQGAALTVDAGAVGHQIFHDVLVGDVWLASGQSNMQLPLAEASTGTEAIAKSENPLLRFTIVPRQQLKVSTALPYHWQTAAPTTVPPVSAVAYFFVRDLQANLQIPLGLVECDYGGSSAESWVSKEVLAKGWPEHEQFLATAGPDFTTKIPQQIPSKLYETMLSSVVPYSLKGVIWYQAESNAARATEYERFFPAQIAFWREIFRFPEMPFLFVQLPRLQDELPKNHGANWSAIRESQFQVSKTVPHTFMAITIDLPLIHFDGPNGAPVHPSTKEPVGARLALGARGTVYHQDLVYSGPVMREAKVVGTQVEIDFDSAGTGLSTLDGTPLRGLYGGPAQGPLKPLTSTSFQGDKLLIDGAADLQLIRYGSETDMGINGLDVNLGNSAGLPSSPFVVNLPPKP